MVTSIYKKEKQSNGMKYLLLLSILFLLAVPQIAALDTEMTAKQGECLNISQTCSSCSYVNISSVSNQNNSNLLSNVGMNYFGNGEWRYEFCETNFIGRYDVRGQGDISGVDESFATFFQVTSSGKNGTENIVFFLFVILFLYGINLLGFFNEQAIMTILGGMALLFLGVYMVNNGIIIYRDNLTNYIGYITIAWGGISSIFAIYKEWIED